MTYEEIFSKLKKKEYAPIYLLMGKEPFFIDQISDYIEDNLIEPENRDFNQVVLYGKETDVPEILANVKEYPFGSPFRLVMVKEAKELKDIDKLKNYAEKPFANAILVICYKYDSVKKPLKDAVEKSGVVFVSDPLKDYKVPEWIQKQSTKYKFKVATPQAKILAEHIGNDLSRINNEFLKLQIVLPPGTEITNAIIEEHIGINKKYNMLELQNALGDRNIPQIYKITHFFAKNQKENPIVRTIAVLNAFFTKLLMYHYTPNKNNDALQTVFETKIPFVIQKNVGYAQRYSIIELKKIIALLREFDLKAKGVDTNATGEELMKELMYKILH